VLADGARGRAIAPSGASTGTHEALELRDGDSVWYGGLGVRQPFKRQYDDRRRSEGADNADNYLRENKHLGANATLAVSMAFAHAAAAEQAQPLWQYLSDGKSTIRHRW
jgi:enolase